MCASRELEREANQQNDATRTSLRGQAKDLRGVRWISAASALCSDVVHVGCHRGGHSVSSS